MICIPLIVFNAAASSPTAPGLAARGGDTSSVYYEGG